jgi:hypothetical protein
MLGHLRHHARLVPCVKFVVVHCLVPVLWQCVEPVLNVPYWFQSHSTPCGGMGDWSCIKCVVHTKLSSQRCVAHISWTEASRPNSSLYILVSWRVIMTFFTPVYSIVFDSTWPTSYNTERQEYWCLLNWPIHHARGRLGRVVKVDRWRGVCSGAKLCAHGDGSELDRLLWSGWGCAVLWLMHSCFHKHYSNT